MSEHSKGEIFTPSSDWQIAVAALTGALNANTDVVSRLADHSTRQDQKLDHIMETLGDMNLRLHLIEQTPLTDRVKTLECDVELLKQDRIERKAIARAIEWIFKNWPGVIGFLLLIGTILALSGKIHIF